MPVSHFYQVVAFTPALSSLVVSVLITYNSGVSGMQRDVVLPELTMHTGQGAQISPLPPVEMAAPKIRLEPSKYDELILTTLINSQNGQVVKK